MFLLVQLLITHGSISTKCASTTPLDMASNPMAPVPQNKSSHRDSGGNCTLLLDPKKFKIISNVAPRTMDIIGRVSNPLGDKSFRLACFPATIVIRRCVLRDASSSFFLLNAVTSFFSSSIANNNSLGTPMRTILSTSPALIPFSVFLALISLLSPTILSGFLFDASAGAFGFFLGDRDDVFTTPDRPSARSFFVGTRT
jgi:hypothetical protein